MQRCHIPFLHRLGCFQPYLLAQFLREFQQSSLPKNSLVLPDIDSKSSGWNPKYLAQLFCVKAHFLAIHLTFHHTLGDRTVSIKLSKVKHRTPHLGVCKKL